MIEPTLFVYRALSRLYPRSVRDADGAAMEQLVRDRARVACREGAAAILRLWIDLLRDAACSIPAAHLDRWRRARGVSPSELVHPPLHTAGGLTVDVIRLELRQSIRAMAQRPMLTLIVLTTLALGIGANTAMFTIVNAVLLRPLPHPDADRLVTLWEANPTLALDRIEVSLPNYRDWQSRLTAIDRLAAMLPLSMTITGSGEAAILPAAAVTADLFPLLGVQPRLGRSFAASDDQPGARSVAIVSERVWQAHLGGTAGALDRPIILNTREYTVIGVMPAGFAYPRADTDIWIPMGLVSGDAPLQNRAVHMMFPLARLAAGRTLEDARAELTQIAAQVHRDHPGADPGHTVDVVSLHEVTVGHVRQTLLLLLASVGAVLLIACANVANIRLAHAGERAREMAIRGALGASRARLLAQAATESLVMAAVGGAIAVLVAHGTLRGLVSLLPADVPRLGELSIDGRVLAFTALASLATGLLFGSLSARHHAPADLNGPLREAAYGSSSRHRTRAALIVVQTAMALLLLVCAGLLIQSLARLRASEMGFDADRLLTLTVSLPRATYRSSAQVIEFFRELPARIEVVPGVRGVSAASSLPISGGDGHGDISIEGRTLTAGETPSASFRRVLPNYFRTLRIPLLEGREFDDRDTGRSPGPVIVNAAFARRFWPEGGAIGQRIKVGPPAHEPWLTIVGVVGDVRNERLDTPPELATYEPHALRPWSTMQVVVRTEGDPGASTAAVRTILRGIADTLLVYDASTMGGRIEESLATRRLTMRLLAVFAGVALLLAAVGIYGAVSHAVSLRTREIGIRAALGAARRDLMTLVIGYGMRLTLTGVIVGLAASVAATRLMTTLLYAIDPADGPTLVGVSVLLVVVSAMACYLPARRATRVDPVTALRAE